VISRVFDRTGPTLSAKRMWGGWAAMIKGGKPRDGGGPGRSALLITPRSHRVGRGHLISGPGDRFGTGSTW